MNDQVQPVQNQAPQNNVPSNIEPPKAPQEQPKAKEPILVVKDNQPGRPNISEEQYKIWLDEMAPFLKTGNTLNYCVDKAGLSKHKPNIYQKYRLDDWFSQKIDAYRAYPGELANKIVVNMIYKINEDMANDRPITKEQQDMLKFFAEKHRTAQPFFVTRTETAQADPKKIGKILDDLENSKSDYDELGREAQKQMVATNTPVQNKEQTG